MEIGPARGYGLNIRAAQNVTHKTLKTHTKCIKLNRQAHLRVGNQQRREFPAVSVRDQGRQPSHIETRTTCDNGFRREKPGPRGPDRAAYVNHKQELPVDRTLHGKRELGRGARLTTNSGAGSSSARACHSFVDGQMAGIPAHMVGGRSAHTLQHGRHRLLAAAACRRRSTGVLTPGHASGHACQSSSTNV